MAPKCKKKWNFTNIIAPKGWVSCTILTKFIGFMRVLSLHTSAKFDCFSSINDKIIKNLPLWGHFQPNFWWPLAAILLIGSKKVRMVQWWHGGPLSSCKVWWKSNDARRRERTKTDVFHFLGRLRRVDLIISIWGSECPSVCPQKVCPIPMKFGM